MDKSDIALIEKCSHLFERYGKVANMPVKLRMEILNLAKSALWIGILLEDYEIKEHL